MVKKTIAMFGSYCYIIESYNEMSGIYVTQRGKLTKKCVLK